MDSLQAAIHRCNLEFDNPTEGHGNCFPNAIVQQCRRPLIKSWLIENKPFAIFKAQAAVRKNITNFALKSNHETVSELKSKYETELRTVERKSWMDYWTCMAKDGTWVDHMFVQMTAWYMELDILIVTSSSTPEAPFILISGDIHKSGKTNGPPILIGNHTNIHYQSLVNQNGHKLEEELKISSNFEHEPQEMDKFNDFTYFQNGIKITKREKK